MIIIDFQIWSFRLFLKNKNIAAHVCRTPSWGVHGLTSAYKFETNDFWFWWLLPDIENFGLEFHRPQTGEILGSRQIVFSFRFLFQLGIDALLQYSRFVYLCLTFDPTKPSIRGRSYTESSRAETYEPVQLLSLQNQLSAQPRELLSEFQGLAFSDSARVKGVECWYKCGWPHTGNISFSAVLDPL